MKKTFVAAAMFCICFQAILVFAATPDFTGEWELDVGKSKLPEMMRIESMTMKVSQTEKKLTIETTTKRSQGEMRGGDGMGGGRMRGNPIVIYDLEGKEMLADIGSGSMAGKETRKAAVTADGKLNLNIIRNFKTDAGDVTMKTNEVWELLDAGKTLKVIRYMETPRGATNAEMYFTNKSPGTMPKTTDVPVTGELSETNNAPLMVGTSRPNDAPAVSGGATIPKKVSAGTLNGKAISLPKPAYPEAARAVRASGAVAVQITIDEQGDIISASAISGHPLLRQAAEEAARSARFAPTLLQGTPVKVTGVLVYNFVP